LTKDSVICKLGFVNKDRPIFFKKSEDITIMKITLTGSLGHINQITIPALIAAGNQVQVITHSASRVAEIEKLGAKALVGSIDDVAFLTTAFTGADAVYLMLTGMGPAGSDPVALGKIQGARYREALDAAKAPYAVDLSSVGADQGPEVGALHAYNLMETELKRATHTTFTFIRPVGFFGNLRANFAQMQTQHVYANNFGPDIQSGWTDPSDIATAVLEAFAQVPAQNQVRYVLSQWLTGHELVAGLATSLDIPDLQWVTITDAQKEAALVKAGMPAIVAHQMTQMSAAQKTSAFYADLRAHEPVHGTMTLDKFLEMTK
jgi:uncharacterized protein YbjT (DUF2867 family)